MAKRKTESYTALDGRIVDTEKRGSISDYESSPSDAGVSFRAVSASHEPMLQSGSSSGSRRPAAFSYAIPRRRFTRYFTLFLAGGLILFMLTLTKLKWVSEKKIQLGYAKPPPKPPAWEEFPFLTRYHGGIRTLTPRSMNKPEYPDPENNTLQAATLTALEEQQQQQQQQDGRHTTSKREAAQLNGTSFSPYPDYNSDDYKQEYEPMLDCFLEEKSQSRIPRLHSYNGVPQGFPDPIMGSYDVLGLRNDMCFDRYGRLSPYGYGYSRKLGGSGAGMDGDGYEEGPKTVWADQLEIDYRNVEWAKAQERCEYKNRFRFLPRSKGRNHFFTTMATGGPDEESPAFTSGEMGEFTAMEHGDVKEGQQEKRAASNKMLLSRTAVLIRTWASYQYDDEDMFYLRALVNELSIQSGGEYTIHFLIHVKDDNLQIWSDDDTYQRVLDEALPVEFRGMGTLWSERQMGLIYGGVAESFFRGLPVHGAYRSTYLPVQYFAHMHPEYDFFWHWEMDIRYTGHFYHLFDRVTKWAAQQPRKGLWERNGRFYVPSEHGSWEDFKQMVRVQTEHGTSHRENMYAKMGSDPKNAHDAESKTEPPVWGPLPPTGQGDTIESANAPTPPRTYAHDEYEWGVGEEADFITFNPLFDPDRTNWILAEDVTGYNTTPPNTFPPRRTAIITASRLSRRLLETMHRETALQRHTMFSEMWPGSTALHHGLKAVYAPHPVYIDRRWPTSYLAAIFNNGRNGASGGARTSVFSDERQHNFLGTTWYYHAGFAANLWKRWLGYKVDNDGGEEFELMGEGRMCLPAMLLHPVKQVDLIYEHQVGE